ncbi:M36 family metallopeptidase [Hymenobacter properus]|uniref:M36 family metallopeptidase n=1 Tax=Hymenobacter properus TaxID=2791026 RepID=A0A931BIL1_9BACT|nr:M36 family metallopeptidase [Hymenobacter properus]MBF9143181.1 M36 family metallopeptidase [Hymenobacter properus]MBR7721989.1 M36 family metallopeptidase [Microvirga sp. SRT04]
MKQFYSRYLAALGLLVGTWLPAKAQTEVSRQAAELALQTREQWAGTGVAAADLRISSARTEGAGLLYAYPQQLQAGIPVYNQVATLVFKSGKLAHHAGSFVPAKAFAGLSAAPRVTAGAAVATAVASLPGHPDFSPASLGAANGPDKQQSFAAAGVARRPIEARLVWAMGPNRTPRLAWNVNVDVKASADWLNIRVDANTGRVLEQDNWTVNEKAEHMAGPAHSDETSASPTRGAASTLSRPSGAKKVSAVTPASYIVVPFPGERPDVTTPVADTNPWLRAGAGNAATTHGWHFDGTTNYLDTRGNNVWAYDDSLKTNAPGRFATSTGTASSLVFNYAPDFTKAATLGKNRRAATVNLFYWNNLMHDVMYQYGFNEASANFQTDNLGRGGTGADHVRAEAQDGGGTNNANFSTPPDGTSGRMQMYLFSAPAKVNVTAPAAAVASYNAVEGAVSTNNKLAAVGAVTGPAVYFDDAGTSPFTHLACGASATSLTGKIALISSLGCTGGYVTKIKSAQTAGAIGVIMLRGIAGGPAIVMGGTDNSITIPAVMVSNADGITLGNLAGSGLAVTIPALPSLDGDNDSGIMVHEYGHGISNRLTGGGSNTSCLYNAEQAGEGWSDFFALMMTTDWGNTPLTDGPRARPMGTYAQGQAASGGGIRRYPYSTNMAVNPLTYANMATSTEVHNIGEIWAVTLWDMTWNIIQQQGRIEPNLYNSASTGGNAVALQLVMQGLKLQPCQPGFLDGRDAILAADSLLYGGRYHCAIWGAFARRGMGASAREGASTSATDQTVAYDLPGVRLSKNLTPLVGNQFAINLTATCECQTQAPVSLTNQLPTGLQYVSSTGGTLSGSTVTFPALSFTQGQQRTFQIVAQTATGAGCAIVRPVNDNRETSTTGGLTPAVVTNGGGNAWAASTARAHSGTTAWACIDPSASSDVTLTSAAFTPTGFSVLSFYHFFSTESIYDGGMVAISVNNGAWQDAASYFLLNGYNSVFASGTASVGKPCFSGISSKASGSAAFQQSLINLTSFSGQSIRVRFQFQSDALNDYGVLPGWFVDDIEVMNGCGGLQQVQLLDNANAVVGSYARATFLTPLPVPVITLLSPNSGTVGTSVTITGTDLTGATGLTLNGAAIAVGAITANTATSLTFTLPAGATTGLLTVTTPYGTSNGLTFTVTYPDLTISTGTTASPTTVAAGTYNSITVTNTGVAQLSGGTVVNTALTVQNGGTFDTNCQPLTGAGSFTLAAGATLRICDPAGISASGATGAVQTTGARSFAADASYVYTSPAATAQATGSGLPATVRNLTNATTGGLTLTQAVGIVQVLALPTTSNLSLNGQALTLLSDANGTALIANTGGGSVTGSTGTLQRHIETNTAASGYRHYASPMVAGVGAETLATLATTGYTPDFSGAAPYNSSATPGLVTPFPTVFSYNQDRIVGLNSTYGTFDKGWQAALGTEVPQVGRGYSVQAPGAALVDFTGTFTTGSVSRANLQRANSDPATGWHLLGNPFPSPLDWSTMTVGTAATNNLQNMDGAVYVYQSSGPYAGSYRTYLGGAPGAASPIIPAGAGFFVHTTSAATPGTVRMAGNNRVTTFGAQPAFGRNAADPRPQLTLELRGTAGRDALTVYADPAATAGVDAALDALKLPNPTGLNLSAQAGTTQLAINGLPAFTTGTVVPLTVGAPAAGAYTLAVSELLNLPAGVAAVLVDTQLNTRTDLATLPATGYAFSVSAAQATAGLSGRFYLNLSAAAPLATAGAHGAATLALFPNPAHGGTATLTGAAPGTVVTVFDAVGRQVTSAPADAKGTATLALPAGLATGVYVVRAGAQALRLTVE